MSNSLLERSVKHGRWNALGNLGTIVISIAFAGVALRFLGTARFGFVMLLQSITAVIIDMGLGQAAIYYVARYYRNHEIREVKEILGTAAFVTLVIGSVAACTIAMSVGPIVTWAKLPPEYTRDGQVGILIYAAVFLISYGSSVLQVIPQALERFDWYNIIKLLQSFGGGIINLAVLLIWPSITALTLSMLITIVIIRTILYFKTKQWLGFWLFPRWNMAEARNLWHFGKAVALNQIGGLLTNSVSQWILVANLGSAALPFIVIPRSMGQRVHGLLTDQANFIFPMLSSESSTRSSASLFAVYDKLQWFVTTFAAVAYTLLIVLAAPILTLWLGIDFAESGTLAWQISMFAFLFMAVNIVPYYVTYSMKRPMANTVTALVVGFGSVLLSALLIPIYGVIGAALSYLVVVPTSTVYAIWIARTILPTVSWRRVFTPYISSVIVVTAGVGGMVTADLLASEPIQYVVLTLGFLSVGFIAVWVYETNFDSSARRIETLLRAVDSMRSLVPKF